MKRNYDIKTTQMNENFENLIYKKFWTEDVIKEWKEMIPNRQVTKNEYKKGFAAILYVLGVYKNNNMLIGNKFSNGYSIKHCPKEFLNSAIRTSHMNLLAFHKLEENWKKYKHLRVFIFWAAKKKEITNYCYLTKPLPEPEPEQNLEKNKKLYINKNQNSNFISSEKRFKLLCEYTEKELPKLTFSKLYDLMKKRSNFTRNQLSKSNMELETDSSKSSINRSENTSESSDNSNSNCLIKINNKNNNDNSKFNNKSIFNRKNCNSNNNSNKNSSIDNFYKITNFIKNIKDDHNNNDNKTKLLPNDAVNKDNNEKIDKEIVEKEIICISSDEETNNKPILDDYKININNNNNTKNNTNNDNNYDNKEKIISKNIINENEKNIILKNKIEPIEISQNNQNEKYENISNRKNDIVDFSQKIGNKENDIQLIDNSEKCGNIGSNNCNINNSIPNLKRKQIADNTINDNKKLKQSNINDINNNKPFNNNLQKLIGQKDSIIIESKKDEDMINDTFEISYNNKNNKIDKKNQDGDNIISVNSDKIKGNITLNKLDTKSNDNINNKKNNISPNNIKELGIETANIELKDNSKTIFEEINDEKQKKVEDNDNILQKKIKMKENDIENKSDENNKNDTLTEQDYEIKAKENKEYFEFLHMTYNKLIKIHSHNRRRTSYIYNYIKKEKLEKTFFKCDPDEIKKLLHTKRRK